MSEDFNFVMDNTAKDKEEKAVESLRESEQRLEDKMIKKTATSGSPESITLKDVEKAKEILGLNLKEKKIATSGDPNVITTEIRAEARKLAESSKGLDIAAFQKKHHIYVMNVDELLKG